MCDYNIYIVVGKHGMNQKKSIGLFQQYPLGYDE